MANVMSNNLTVPYFTLLKIPVIYRNSNDLEISYHVKLHLLAIQISEQDGKYSM